MCHAHVYRRRLVRHFVRAIRLIQLSSVGESRHRPCCALIRGLFGSALF